MYHIITKILLGMARKMRKFRNSLIKNIHPFYGPYGPYVSWPFSFGSEVTHAITAIIMANIINIVAAVERIE